MDIFQTQWDNTGTTIRGCATPKWCDENSKESRELRITCSETNLCNKAEESTKASPQLMLVISVIILLLKLIFLDILKNADDHLKIDSSSHGVIYCILVETRYESQPQVLCD